MKVTNEGKVGGISALGLDELEVNVGSLLRYFSQVGWQKGEESLLGLREGGCRECWSSMEFDEGEKGVIGRGLSGDGVQGIEMKGETLGSLRNAPSMMVLWMASDCISDSVAASHLDLWQAAAQTFSQETLIMCCIQYCSVHGTRMTSRHQRTILVGGALSDGLRKYSNTQHIQYSIMLCDSLETID